MSWLQHEKRRAQGSWVSAMPGQQPMVAGYARARMQACPLVGLVGACCSGCAAGKGCGAAEELEHHHGSVGISFGWHVPSFTETAIPWDDVERANVAVTHVQDVVPALDGFPPGSPEANRRDLWRAFYKEWVSWYAPTKGKLDAIPGFDAKFITEGAADQYKVLAAKFNDQLEALKAMKVADLAGPIDTRSPAGQAFDAAVDAAAGGAGELAGAGLETLKWIGIAGAVGLVLYFGAPLLLSRFLK